MPTSSVILCTRNRLSDIVRCLASLKQQTIAPTEIIIVDSSDVSLAKNNEFKVSFSHDFFTKSKIKYFHTKPGLTYQRNYGIKHARGDIVYFFDDDTILDKTYLAEMNKVFEQNPDYAAGMGDITNIQNQSRRYQLFRKFFMLPRMYDSGNFTLSGMPTHPYGTKKFKEIEILGGCCMAFRKNILNYYIFDEMLAGYCYMEDCDIGRRISYEHSIFFNPRARLQHLESVESRDKIERNAQMLIANYRYLFFKNFYPRQRIKIVFLVWSILGLFFEAILQANFKKVRGYLMGLFMRCK